MLLALLFAAGMNVYAYWFSDKAVLKMYGAQEVNAENNYGDGQFRSYYNMVKELAANAQLPMPKVYVMNEQQPNAFATGRNPEHAAVAATVGIMQALSERELRGVMAHELAHVKHRDTLISTISATVAGAIGSLAQFGMFFGGGRNEDGERSVSPIVSMLMMFLAPLAASLIQMAISRSREFEADRGGAEISKDPQALADALIKISNYAHQIPNETAEMHPETGQMMIINPLSGMSFDSLFSTHPKTEERVAKLRAMVV
jgi:heat shock protein HtpX